MKHTNRIRSLRALLLPVALLSLLSPVTIPFAHAQATPATPSDSNQVVELSPYVISSAEDEGYSSRQTSLSTRSAKNLLEIPSSLQIINKELLDDLNSNLMTAINFGVSGVNANQKVADDMTIRGFRATTTMRNGVIKYNYKKMPLYDVERVEVIKGPLNMVLANSYIGGGVNTITKSPTAQFASTAELMVGDHSTFKATYNQSGPLYVGKENKVLYRVTLGGLTGKHEKEAVSYDERFVGGSLRFDLGSTQTLTVDTYFFADNNYETWEDFLDISITAQKNGLTLAKLHPNSTKSFSSSRSRDTKWENEDFYLNTSYLAKLGDGNLRVSYSYSRNHDEELLHQGVFTLADNYMLRRRFIPADVVWKNHNLQVDYRYDLKLSWLTLENMVGMDYQKSFNRYADGNTRTPDLDTRPGYIDAILDADSAWIAANVTKNYPLDDPQAPAGYDSQTSGDNTSFYIQENAKLLNDKLILIGGLRYSPAGESNTVDRSNGVVTPTPTSFGKSYKTHRIGVIYKVLPSVVLYAQTAENVIPQSGVLREPGYDGPDDPGELRKDQAGVVKEAGVKFDHKFSDRVNMFGSLVYFNQYLTNVRTLVTGNTGIPILVQSAKDSVKGIEFDLTARYKTSNGFADAILTVYDADGKTAEGLPVNNHSELIVSLLGKYTFTSGPLRGLMLGGGVSDTGDMRAGGSYWVETKPTYVAFGRYQFNRKLSLQLNLQNITSERNIIGIGASGLVQVTDPIRTTLTARYTF